MEAFHEVIDVEDRRRREKLLSCIHFLMRKGLVDPELKPQSEHLCHGGNLMKELAAPALLVILPGASVQEYSAFLQMAICAYNMETFWDLAQIHRLLPTKDKDRKLSFQEKGNRVQTLIGSIRHHSMNEIGSVPLSDDCGVTHTIASFVVRCVVLELIYIRSIEYSTKAASVWVREHAPSDGDPGKKRVVQLRKLDNAFFMRYVRRLMEFDLSRSTPMLPNALIGPSEVNLNLFQHENRPM